MSVLVGGGFARPSPQSVKSSPSPTVLCPAGPKPSFALKVAPGYEATTVVGRIVFDADSTATTGIKLNEAALTLESSRSMGAGVRVPLKFDPSVRLRGAKKGIGGVGLFPGAILALRGRNGGGGWFTVTEVLPVS